MPHIHIRYISMRDDDDTTEINHGSLCIGDIPSMARPDLHGIVSDKLSEIIPDLEADRVIFCPNDKTVVIFTAWAIDDN